MEQQEIKARIEAIQYILENDLIAEEALSDAEEELYELSHMLPAVEGGANSEVKEDVTQPSHYKIGIDVYAAVAKNKDAYDGFLHLNATKYLHRCYHKHDTPVDDLGKAKWYITELLKGYE